jgi:hypothetical protein
MKPADEDKVKYRVAMEVLEELNIAVPSILEEKVYD